MICALPDDLQLDLCFVSASVMDFSPLPETAFPSSSPSSSLIGSYPYPRTSSFIYFRKEINQYQESSISISGNEGI